MAYLSFNEGFFDAVKNNVKRNINNASNFVQSGINKIGNVSNTVGNTINNAANTVSGGIQKATNFITGNNQQNNQRVLNNNNVSQVNKIKRQLPNGIRNTTKPLGMREETNDDRASNSGWTLINNATSLENKGAIKLSDKTEAEKRAKHFITHGIARLDKDS